MRRRSVLKRIGAAGVGITALAGSGAAQTNKVGGRTVEIDGEAYFFKEGVSPDDVSLERCCCPRNCDNEHCDCCVLVC